jgi:serine/threonine protein kinase
LFSFQHKLVRNNTCCPTFLFANAGPWFAILGAVFTDKVIVQRLTDYIWVGMDSTLNEPHCNRVAQVMLSLRRSVEKLREYYIGLHIITVGPSDVHPRFFPSIHSYSNDKGKAVKFKYIKPLELDSTCVTFLAETLTDSPKSVVVKFVQRYGEEAHRVLAEKNLAPQLLYFGKVAVEHGDPSYGHLRMVVMQYVDGMTLDKAKRIGQVPATLVDQVQLALHHLHTKSLVFGDLRPSNIMITKNQDVKLIDFDWAGTHQRSRYPLLMSPVLRWPSGVGGLSVMEMWHDNDMFERLLETTT